MFIFSNNKYFAILLGRLGVACPLTASRLDKPLIVYCLSHQLLVYCLSILVYSTLVLLGLGFHERDSNCTSQLAVRSITVLSSSEHSSIISC